MQRAALRIAVVTAFALACGAPATPPVAQPEPTKPAVTPMPASSAQLSPITPFPSLPLLIGTWDGRIHHGVDAAGATIPGVQVCTGRVWRIEVAPSGAEAIVACDDGAGRIVGLRYDLASRRATELRLGEPYIPPTLAWSGDGKLVAYLAPGDCPMPAPICKTRVLLNEMATGQVRQVHADEYNVGELRWTALGLTVFLPQRSPSGIRPPDKAGTFLWDGRNWSRLSQHRLVATDGTRQIVFETEPEDPNRQGLLLERVGGRERQLTPPGVASEQFLALLSDGRVIGWRQGEGSGDGAVVTYRDGQLVRLDRGAFSADQVVRSGDWIVALALSGAPAASFRAYSLASGVFASAPGGAQVSALGAAGR